MDSLVVTQDPGGPYIKHLFQQKAFHLPCGSGGILVAYAGYRKFGILRSLYEEGLAQLGTTPTFEVVVNMFASLVGARLTEESIKDSQPQPAEFILGSWWVGERPRLAVVHGLDISWPPEFRTVAIGGNSVWAAMTDLEGLHVPEDQPITETLLARLGSYIASKPASNYDFPLGWVTLSGPEKWNWGFVDASMNPVSAPAS